MNTIKKGIVLLGLILSCTTIQAQSINFETGDWATIKNRAKEENKLIFVDVYTTWCGPCKKMDKYIFTDKKVGDYYNAHFISYKLDAEKGEGVLLSKKYEVTSYPNLLFVDGNGDLVIRKSGTMGVEEMLEFGNRAVHSKKEATAMTSAYNAGNRTPEFILKYLIFLKERDQPTEEIMVNYLEGTEKQHWLSEDNFRLMEAYIHSPYNTVIDYLAKQRAETGFAYDFWTYQIHNFVYEQYLKHLVKERRAPQEISKLLSHASSKLSPLESAYLNFRAKIETAHRDQNWDSYVKHTIAYVNTYEKQPVRLNHYAWKFYKYDAITDPKALNAALKWVNKALAKEKGYNAMDTKAALLYKMGRKEEALIAANNAIKFAKKNGDDPLPTLKLIEKIKTL